jgi:hypothetical protein
MKSKRKGEKLRKGEKSPKSKEFAGGGLYFKRLVK